jgi:hypothetical protein
VEPDRGHRLRLRRQLRGGHRRRRPVGLEPGKLRLGPPRRRTRGWRRRAGKSVREVGPKSEASDPTQPYNASFQRRKSVPIPKAENPPQPDEGAEYRPLGLRSGDT